MHKALVDTYVAKVRQRHAEGDCPITERVPHEQLEFALIAIADALSTAEAELVRVRAALEGALRPFGPFGLFLSGGDEEVAFQFYDLKLTNGDFRRARASLESSREPTSSGANEP